MDYTTEDVARLVVALLDVCLDEIGKTEVAGFVGLDNLPRKLVESKEMVVFVNYLVREVHGLTLIEDYCSAV
jgi:hypothetical protein